MLKTLDIENVALIDKVSLDFSSNLNVLSGETGAGKSIIIDSLNFVLGGKANKNLIKQNFDFTKWARQGDVYMASYTAFQEYSYDLLRKLFVPQPEIQQTIDRRCARFTARTIGVHIRRTDNTASIQQSPIELFYTAIDRELDAHPELSIYLATDSETVKQELKDRYGNRLFCAQKEADRSSTAGIQDGVADMYTLARTHKIFGSFQSSFSELASQLGNVPLEIVKKI